MTQLGLLGAALVLGFTTGCSKELEIRGESKRAIGERVTVELVSGSGSLDDPISLESGGTTISEAELDIIRSGNRELSFRVPIGIPVGPARLNVPKGGGEDYHIALQISRFAVIVTDLGVVQAVPLPGSSVEEPIEIATNASGAKLALSPDGGELAVLKRAEVEVFAMGGQFQRLAQRGVTGGVGVAALGGSVLVATETQVELYRISDDQGMSLDQAVVLSGIRALGVSAEGDQARVLADCATITGECLFLIEIQGANTGLRGQEIPLDDTANGTAVGVSADGAAVVAADPERAHGVSLGDVNRLPWSDVVCPTTPDCPIVPEVPATIDSTSDKVFVIAPTPNSTLSIVGFPPGGGFGPLEVGGEQVVFRFQGAPTAAGFGRGLDLYTSVGTNILRVLIEAPEPSGLAKSELVFPASDLITTMVVQH